MEEHHVRTCRIAGIDPESQDTVLVGRVTERCTLNHSGNSEVTNAETNSAAADIEVPAMTGEEMLERLRVGRCLYVAREATG